MDGIEVDEQDVAEHPTVVAGTVDIDDWVSQRLAASANLRGRFCAVTASATIAALHPRFSGPATSLYGLKDFDAAALKDARPRELTQAVSQFLWAAKDVDENDLCDGVEFLSRHGDDLVLWVVFERPGDGQISPRISNVEHVELTRNTPEVVDVFAVFGLTMLPQRGIKTA